MGTVEGHICACDVLRTVPGTEQVLRDTSPIWAGSLSKSHCGMWSVGPPDEAE